LLLRNSIIIRYSLKNYQGSKMVPSKLATDKSIAYIIPFGISALSTTILLSIPYYLIKREYPVFHVQYALIPGVANGLMWSVGNYLATYIAMSPLGISVGVPLTQTGLAISAFWGIFVFKEIRGWLNLIQFLLGLCLLIPG
jgi:glucose uptake protein GlcU